MRDALALEVCQRAIQQDQPARTLLVPDAVEALFPVLGEASAHRFLVARQDVDRKLASSSARPMHRGRVVDATSTSGGSSETDDRLLAVMPCGPAVGVTRGQDGDAGREAPEELAEVCLVDGVRSQHHPREEAAD